MHGPLTTRHDTTRQHVRERGPPRGFLNDTHLRTREGREGGVQIGARVPLCICTPAHDSLHVQVRTVRLQGLPVFFGIVTSAFEGIGCVLPIENTVRGSPQVFTALLDWALALVTLILGSFGAVGYLTYGDGVRVEPNVCGGATDAQRQVHDIIVLNLPDNVPVTVLKVCLIIGVFFTYPLQLLPVSRIIERLALRRVCTTSVLSRACQGTHALHSPEECGTMKTLADLCGRAFLNTDESTPTTMTMMMTTVMMMMSKTASKMT